MGSPDNPIGWTFCTPEEGVDADDHVIPDNDIRDHELSPDCWCRPQDDHDAHDYVWMHNAADGRTTYGDGTRKLN